MARRMFFGDEARTRLLSGIDILARAVRPTLGPSGRNVAVDGRRMAGTKRYGPPQVSAQAQHIIRDLELADRSENIGVELLKQAAKQTDALVGDGTSTTIVLAHAMIRQGIKNIAAGANPMIIKRGMEKALRAASEAILETALPLQGMLDIRQVMLSASRSEDIAEALIWAVDEVGTDGMMLVERCPNTLGIVVECEHGFQYDRGFLSPYFVTDPEQESVELEEPHVLLTSEDITSADELLPLYRRLQQHVAPSLLVLAPDLKGGALGFLVANHRRGAVRCVAARPPSHGSYRQDMLQDLAIFTGGVIASETTGYRLRDLSIDDLGRADSVYVTAKDTSIVDGKGASDAIRGRIAQLKERMREITDSYETEKLERRVAQLSGGLARIKVGGATEVEMDNRVELVESALTSMRATVLEGVVAGAGVAFLKAGSALAELGAEGDEATGVAIVRRALEEPLRQIAANNGVSGSVIMSTLERLQASDDQKTFGYDARHGEFCDVLERGLVDPCRTVRVALANATSCAMMVLTMEAMSVTE